MALTEGDKAIIRETAFEVGNVVAERLMQSFEDICARRRAECPVKEQVAAMTNQRKGAKALAGLIVGAVGLVGSLLGAIATWIALRTNT